ncbi:MAG: hypothetical protein JXQ90_18290 [Cyclobacteriaceae bacterium]
MKTAFNEFLQNNKIKVESLAEPIQKKITIFYKMVADLKEAEEGDKKLLQGKIEELNQEIYDDLLEEFEDQLANNEEIEEKQSPPAKPAQKLTPNELVLKKLYDEGNTENLSKSYLNSRGLKANYTEWEIDVGGFRLKRTHVFKYLFKLIKP